MAWSILCSTFYTGWSSKRRAIVLNDILTSIQNPAEREFFNCWMHFIWVGACWVSVFFSVAEKKGFVYKLVPWWDFGDYVCFDKSRTVQAFRQECFITMTTVVWFVHAGFPVLIGHISYSYSNIWTTRISHLLIIIPTGCIRRVCCFLHGRKSVLSAVPMRNKVFLWENVCECDCEEAQYFCHIALLFPTEVIQTLSHPKTDETIRYICILQKSLTLSSHGACANASELWGFPESSFQ